MVGCCVARLLGRFPGVRVTLVDVDPARADVAAALGVGFALPGDAAGGRDLVVHASATSAGLQQSLDLLAPEGTVVDLSWYGDAEVRLSLGGAFHSGRLRPPGQPGRHRVAGPPRDGVPRPSGWRSPWTCCGTRRSTRCSPAPRRFDELPDVLARLAGGSLPALCHTVTYGEE